MSFKTLHTFTVTLEKQVDETSTRTEGGQTITTTTKVTKPVEYTILLREPTRSQKQELALFQTVTYNAAINLGLLPKLVMQQKIGRDNSDNPLSEGHDRKVAEMNTRLQELYNEILELGSAQGKQEAIDEDARKARRNHATLEYWALFGKVQEVNAAYQSVYEHTAEHYTQNKMLTWLVLFLSYIKEPGTSDSVPRLLCGGADFSTKEKALNDLLDAGDELHLKIIDKLPAYWSLYLFGRASSAEDYARIEKEYQERTAAEAKLEAARVAAEADAEAKKQAAEPPEAAPAA